MSDQPVNLNRVRKEKARVQKRARADENAVKFGRTKAEKQLEAARKQKSPTILWDQDEPAPAPPAATPLRAAE